MEDVQLNIEFAKTVPPLPEGVFAHWEGSKCHLFTYVGEKKLGISFDRANPNAADMRAAAIHWIAILKTDSTEGRR